MTARFRPRILSALAIAASCALMAQAPAERAVPGHSSAPSRRIGPSATEQLAIDLDAIINDHAFNDATWGISVVSCESGETLYRWNDHQNRQVASNMKLLTTAAALRRLGSAYRFATPIYLAPPAPGSGALDPDLVIRASGDPSMSATFGHEPQEMIARWARILDSLGVHAINNIIVDASEFDDVPFGPGWAWDDEPFGFAAPVSAAAIHDNAITVTVTPGRAAGRSVLIDISPATAYVTLQVTAVTSRPDSTATLDIRRERDDGVIQVSGNIGAGAEPYTDYISIDDPPVFFATLVQEELMRRGIAVHGSPTDAAERPKPLDYRSLRPFYVHYSDALRDIIATTNKQSVNLAAEMLLKKLGSEFGSGGTTAAGLDIVRAMLAEAGIDVDHVRLYDGSGLSRQGMLAPYDLTHLLRWMKRSPLGTAYMSTLSIAGQDGTLAKRMKGTLAEGNVVAKTGYMGGVRAISGYARSRDGEWLAFSIVTNNYSVPTSVVNTAQDLILMRLASFSKRI